MTRNLQFQDLKAIQDWCPKEYPFPDLASGLYCSQKALLARDGKLAGAALLKLTCEAVLIIDPNVPRLEKARLVKDAFSSLTDDGTKKFGLDQVQFVLRPGDDHYAQILKKHFNFQDQPGIPLIRWY